MEIRACTTNDISDVRQFISTCKPLGLHTPFTYWVMFQYFSDTSFIMIEDNKIIGFALGLKSSLHEGVLYFWQIGIDQVYRGKHYSHLLIDKMIASAKKQNCSRIQFSIEPDNAASYNNMAKYAKKNNIPMKKADEIRYHDVLSGKKELEYLYEFVI